MKVLSSKFVKSAMAPEHYPADRRPEFAFVGRSNVGKSTLLNTLLHKKGLAKTSSTPGKTQCINFFDVNGKIHFVDLPGYGYAKVPKSMKRHWNKLMLEYLTEREQLKLVAALVDARHEPSEKDLHMLHILEEAEVPVLVVATKIDKVKPSQRTRHLARIQKAFGFESDAYVLPFSGITGEGVKDLWSVFDDVL